MREIRKQDIDGFWLVKPLENCEFDENLFFYFSKNKVTINGTNICNSKYEIVNGEGTKILKIEGHDSFLEIWMIMDDDLNSLIVNYNKKRFYIEKRFHIEKRSNV
jgi:hypothetical protein